MLRHRIKHGRIEDYARPEKVAELKRLLLARSIVAWAMMALSLTFAVLSYSMNADTQDLLDTIEHLHEIRSEPSARSYLV